MTPEELAGYEFAAGSMGPKVEAATRFVAKTGQRAAIGSLADIAGIVAGQRGHQRGHARGGGVTSQAGCPRPAWLPEASGTRATRWRSAAYRYAAIPAEPSLTASPATQSDTRGK